MSFERTTEILVKIKTMDMKNYALSVDKNISVKHLKELIEDKYGPETKLQRLIFQGRVLSDPESLNHYDLSHNDVIHLVVTQNSPSFHRTRGRTERQVGDISNERGVPRNRGRELNYDAYGELDLNDSMSINFDPDIEGSPLLDDDEEDELSIVEEWEDAFGPTQTETERDYDDYVSDSSTILEIEIFSTIDDPESTNNPLKSFFLVFVVNILMIFGLHVLIGSYLGMLVMTAMSFLCYMLIRSLSIYNSESADAESQEEDIVGE